MNITLHFPEIWVCDFEFIAQAGDIPTPVCAVFKEVKTGRVIRLWKDDLEKLLQPPFDTNNALFVAYYASAEFSCFLELGWPRPKFILDLYAEFRNLNSGLPVTSGFSLLGAMAHYGLPAIDSVEKETMRNLILRGNWSDKDKESILEYCLSDVLATEQLLKAMLPKLDIDRAMIRGRFMWSIALIERQGIPIDTETLTKLRTNWPEIQKHLIQQVDSDFGVYDGLTFKTDKFSKWLEKEGILWPRLPSGTIALDDDTFRQQAQLHTQLEPLRNLRTTLSQLRLNDLSVGKDGRNRCLLSPYASKTGRNQPSNSKFIFGTASWIRHLIQPAENKALAYIDFEQQEFGIAAKLSGDVAMQHAYLSSDPYLTFAKQAGAVPPEGTKQQYKHTRDKFKQTSLAVQYGMGAEALARKLDISPAQAKNLIDLHKKTYSKYWQWSDSIETFVQFKGKLQAAFGWSVHLGQNANYRSFRNFPLQANGSEMLRLACIFAHERGVQICAPVHDALLIEAATDKIDVAVAATQEAMVKASSIVLDGFTLRTEAKIFRYPERFFDERGVKMWSIVQNILEIL